MQRRTFIKVGLAGGTVLAAAGVASWLIGRDPVADRREVLDALIPVVLDGALPAEAPRRGAALAQARAAVDTAIAALAPASQDELAQLFALMAIPPSRLALAGLSQPWRDAAPAEIAAVLQSWRTHRIALLQSAYLALHDLIVGGWYADPSHWAALGYDGPPRL